MKREITKLDVSDMVEFSNQVDTYLLTQITTTTGSNGYPENLDSRHVIGFDEYAQAQEYVERNGGTITLYSKRDGHGFYKKHARKDEPLTSDDYLADLGDNYSTIGDISELNDRFRDEIVELVELFDFNEAKTMLKEREAIIKAIENCPEDSICVMNGLFFREYAKLETMSYHEDVTTYVIGVDLSEVMIEDENQ